MTAGAASTGPSSESLQETHGKFWRSGSAARRLSSEGGHGGAPTPACTADRDGVEAVGLAADPATQLDSVAQEKRASGESAAPVKCPQLTERLAGPLVAPKFNEIANPAIALSP